MVNDEPSETRRATCNHICIVSVTHTPHICVIISELYKFSISVISPKNVAKGLSSVRGCGERVVGRWMQSQETSDASFLFPTKP